MSDSWSCLLVNKGPGLLPEKVSLVLKIAACDLHRQKWDTMRLSNDIAIGIISTEWNTYSVGGRSGVLFRAHVDCESGTDYQVNFLLSERDLEHGAKILQEREERGEIGWQESRTPFPIPELYQFKDLRGPSRGLH